MHDAAVIPSLIFDLDGTLVDSLPGIANSLNRVLAQQRLPQHPLPAVRNFVGDGLRMLIKRSLPDGTDETSIDSLVAAFKADYERTWADGTHPYPSIPSILKELQRDGYPLAILSNKTHTFTQTIARECFRDIHFTMVLGQQDGVPHKPHPNGALNLANALGSSPQHCILIGDSIVDHETAENAGMIPIAVTWGYHDREKLLRAGATRFAEHPAALPQMIREVANDTV